MINAHRLDIAANQLAEQLATNTPSGSPRQEAQELLASLRDYRTRAAAAGQHQAETDAELIWTIENALAAALEPETDEPTPAQKAHEPGWTARILAAKLAADQATDYARHANDTAQASQDDHARALKDVRTTTTAREEAQRAHWSARSRVVFAEASAAEHQTTEAFDTAKQAAANLDRARKDHADACEHHRHALSHADRASETASAAKIRRTNARHIAAKAQAAHEELVRAHGRANE